ncbi:tRNA 2-thiocytidine(32) synthetase TtcA, partial [Ralstonia pickettii]|nr:tRNA 2-thiocytidine(32) synthetase TtcA [Ralstonia pickettii]
MNAPHMNDAAADAATHDAAADPAGRPALTRREQKEAYENNKLFKRIVRQVGQAI